MPRVCPHDVDLEEQPVDKGALQIRCFLHFVGNVMSSSKLMTLIKVPKLFQLNLNL